MKHQPIHSNTASYLYAISTATGWSLDDVLWRVPVTVGLQIVQLSARAHGALTRPTPERLQRELSRFMRKVVTNG